tara:strand:+ start:539 stop:1300 length:762 start_codon:yes stop_codon:yes gene_type:complete
MFNTGKRFFFTLQSLDTHFYVLSIVLSIMGGYLINAFYDFEKDMINQPDKTYFNRIVSKKSCLNLYVICVLSSIIIAYLINYKIWIFIIMLNVALWIYSHKLRKKPLLGEISASLLMISFFVGISVLYMKIDKTLIIFSTYILTIDLTREIIKKMISLKGDLIVGEKSIPILFGIKKSKYIIFYMMISSILAILTLLPIIIETYISIYFIISLLIISVNIYMLHHARNAKHYERINTCYKLIIGLAILSIVLY